MILSSARAMMIHLIRSATLKPPSGTSPEVAERELAELFQPPPYSDIPTDVPPAVFPLLEPRDTDPDVLRFRSIATIHPYPRHHVQRRAELLRLLDEAADGFRHQDRQAGWHGLVRFAQLFRTVGGDPDIVYFTIAQGVIDWDACRVFWDNPTMEAIEDDDQWEARHTSLVTQALRDIGETEMAFLYLHNFKEHDRRFDAGRAKFLTALT